MEKNFTVCSVDDLTDPGAREFSIGAGDWPLRGFVVLVQGELRAYVNRCPHAGLPLNFKPDVFFAPAQPLLQCTVHGALFAPLTGECVAGPCMGRALQAIPVALRTENGMATVVVEVSVLS